MHRWQRLLLKSRPSSPQSWSVPDHAGAVADGAHGRAADPRCRTSPASAPLAGVPALLRLPPAGEALWATIGQVRDLPALVAVRAPCPWLWYAARARRPKLSRPVAAAVVAADRARCLFELPATKAQGRLPMARYYVRGPVLPAFAALAHGPRVSRAAVSHRAWRRGSGHAWERCSGRRPAPPSGAQDVPGH